MATIFWLSSRTAEQSSQQSSFVLNRLIALFGDNIFTDFIVRKAAHCLEFTGLSLLFNISLYQSTGKTHCITATVLTSLYAVTDEVHQFFVEGRSCQLSDWGIDTMGAALGTLGFIVLFVTAKAFIKKYIDRTNN